MRKGEEEVFGARVGYCGRCAGFGCCSPCLAGDNCPRGRFPLRREEREGKLTRQVNFKVDIVDILPPLLAQVGLQLCLVV